MPTVLPGRRSRAGKCSGTGVGHQAEKKQQLLSCSKHFHLKFKCHILLEISSRIPPPATGKGAKATSSYQKTPEVSHLPIRLIAAMISQLRRAKQFQQKRLGMPHRRTLACPGLGKSREPAPNEASVGIHKQVPLLMATALSPGMGL